MVHEGVGFTRRFLHSPGIYARAGVRSLALVLFLLALPLSAQTDPTLWPEPQRAFFQDGPGLLLSAEERSEILGTGEAGRERLIRELLDRDPIPETPENELRLGIERRTRLVQEQLPSPRDARAQLLFLRGRPAERLVVDCAAAFKPLEIWVYRLRQAIPAVRRRTSCSTVPRPPSPSASGCPSTPSAPSTPARWSSGWPSGTS